MGRMGRIGLTTTPNVACPNACPSEPKNASDLQAVIDAWPDLGDETKADILAMVQAVRMVE